ncbi:hypothetical protein [Priestia megaterium]|uniref:hypothetical protein n=1 Tax=Priestia megaterium TaxID=1404 RepID=UPI002E210339|nr:hypothetical protein [Priestia megaterium]
MKKNTDALKLKKGLYKSLEDIEEEDHKKVNAKKDAKAEKAKLMQRFNIDASTIK